MCVVIYASDLSESVDSRDETLRSLPDGLEDLVRKDRIEDVLVQRLDNPAIDAGCRNSDNDTAIEYSRFVGGDFLL